jgi:hypothetical protein
MVTLNNGTVPGGIVAGLLPDGQVKVGDYVISAHDWRQLVKDVGNRPRAERLTDAQE